MDKVSRTPRRRGRRPPPRDLAGPRGDGDRHGEAPILEVDDLQMYFPVKSSGLIRRTIGHVQAVDGVSFEVPKGGVARPGR